MSDRQEDAGLGAFLDDLEDESDADETIGEELLVRSGELFGDDDDSLDLEELERLLPSRDEIPGLHDDLSLEHDPKAFGLRHQAMLDALQRAKDGVQQWGAEGNQDDDEEGEDDFLCSSSDTDTEGNGSGLFFEEEAIARQGFLSMISVLLWEPGHIISSSDGKIGVFVASSFSNNVHDDFELFVPEWGDSQTEPPLFRRTNPLAVVMFVSNGHNHFAVNRNDIASFIVQHAERLSFVFHDVASQFFLIHDFLDLLSVQSPSPTLVSGQDLLWEIVNKNKTHDTMILDQLIRFSLFPLSPFP